MTPEQLRALHISLRAVKKCWRCYKRKPVQEFAPGVSLYCRACNVDYAAVQRRRRQAA